MRTSNFVSFSISKFFEKLRKILKTVISPKLQGLDQSYLQARYAAPKSIITLTAHITEMAINNFEEKNSI